MRPSRISAIGLLLTAALIAGCTGDLKEQVREQQERMDTLSEQLARLEAANQSLQAALERPASTPEPAPTVPASNMVVNVTPEVVSSLAEQINALVLARLESTVDERIATQVGTADDIEAIFSELVVEEIDAREEAEQREREERRLREAAERDTRSVERRLETMELSEDKQQQVIATRRAMREQLDADLALLRERDAPPEELMAAVADQRVQYEAQLTDLLDDEQLQAYFYDNRWVQRDQERLAQLSETLQLEQGQLDTLVDAYDVRRNTFSDGFYLAQRGYLGRGDMRETFEQTQQSLQTTMQSVLTPEQYAVYEESGLADERPPGFGRRGGRDRR